MFVNLVKIKKYLIYLFLFLFFSCFFSASTKAASYDSVLYQLPASKATHAQWLRGIAFDIYEIKVGISKINWFNFAF